MRHSLQFFREFCRRRAAVAAAIVAHAALSVLAALRLPREMLVRVVLVAGQCDGSKLVTVGVPGGAGEGQAG
jgi:hypothetical protein